MPRSADLDAEAGRRLAALSEPEKAVLDLLAQGHTAKSIAALTGRSETAVNERLRSARRKTGVGSSRELARLLRTQEFRNQGNRFVAERGPAAASRRPARPRWPAPRTSKGILMTLVIAMAATALLSQATDRPHAANPPSVTDPLAAPLMQPGPNFAELHARVRAEARDEAWASSAEATLSSAFTEAAGVPGVAQSVRVICGATLCEVVGWVDGDDKAVAAAVQALQSAALEKQEREHGLAEFGIGFGSDPGKPHRAPFITYLKRLDR